jgi:hypothetical protein
MSTIARISFPPANAVHVKRWIRETRPEHVHARRSWIYIGQLLPMADYNDKGGPWVVHDKPLRSSPDREWHAGLMPVYAWRHCIRHLSTNDGSVDEKPDLLVACETAYCSATGSERHRREAQSRSISAWRRLLQHPFPNHGDAHERMASGPHIRIPLFLPRAPSKTIAMWVHAPQIPGTVSLHPLLPITVMWAAYSLPQLLFAAGSARAVERWHGPCVPEAIYFNVSLPMKTNGETILASGSHLRGGGQPLSSPPSQVGQCTVLSAVTRQ